MPQARGAPHTLHTVSCVAHGEKCTRLGSRHWRLYLLHSLHPQLLEKYSRLTDAFKHIDSDRTGHLEREEVKKLLVDFNIPDIKDAAIETLIDFADYDGDGEINYAEFARVLTADDVMAMKNTLAGNVS